MARPSRPPGFDMTYRPAETVFGPPWVARVPALLYLAAVALVVSVVVAGYLAPPGSALHEYVVDRDVYRLMSARTFATLLAVSALATLARSGMRGVRLYGDGLVFRDVLALGWPRVRRYRWAQIDCIVLDQPKSIALDLWDGTRTFLPHVGDRDALAAALEKVAHARAIPVRGGVGLDEIPESDEFADDEA